MKLPTLAIATVVLVAGQTAPVLAQATAPERQLRNHMGQEEGQVRADTAHITALNAQVRAVRVRVDHDRAALDTDQRELARLNAEEASARKGEAALNAEDHSQLKEYRQDLSQGPH